MQNYQVTLFLSLFLLLISFEGQTYHIVGGEITYECVNAQNGTYDIQLVVYRDCLGNGAELDDPAYLFIYENKTLKQRIVTGLDRINRVAPPEDICIQTLPDVCLQKGEYKERVTLGPTDFGYTIVYQRYSRNITIANIRQPGETGSSYTAFIPPSDLAACNNSPIFNSFPPTVVCANTKLRIEQSAFDVDGDSLVYALCNPLIGGSNMCVQPGSPQQCDPPRAPAPPPPYPSVSWISPYNANNPIGGSPNLTIDPVTGILRGFPDRIGQFVVGICVTEYRNGVEIGNIKRDFQFNIEDCEIVSSAVEANEITVTGSFLINNCQGGYSVLFVNESIGAKSYEWHFDDPTTEDDFSTEVNPLYAYPDTGTYIVQLIGYSFLENCIDTAFIEVKLYPGLNVDFNVDGVCTGMPFQFEDISQMSFGEAEDWTWDMGDGTIIEGEANPVHVFNQGGDIEVNLEVITNLGCRFDTTKTINVIDRHIPSFEVQTSCFDGDVQANITSNIGALADWTWDFNDPLALGESNPNEANPRHSYTLPTDDAQRHIIRLLIEDRNGCITEQRQTINLYPDFEVQVGDGHEICEGQSVQLTSSLPFDWLTYEWFPQTGMDNPNTLNPVVSPNRTTTYQLIAKDPNGCEKRGRITVTVHPTPPITLSEGGSICLGDDFDITANYTGDAELRNISWTGLGTNNQQDLAITVAPTRNSDYTIRVIDEFGCNNSATISVVVIPEVTVNAGQDTSVCVGEVINLAGSVGNADDFAWNLDQDLSGTDLLNPAAKPSQDKTFTLNASNSCFEASDEVFVKVNGRPEVSTAFDSIRIDIGDSIQLDGGSSISASWSPPETLDDPLSPSPYANPIQNTTYYYTSIDVNGCAGTDSITVYVNNIFEVMLPTAFSPNSDGLNDDFRIIRQRGLKELVELSVYNRWGDKLFSTNRFDKGWNGMKEFKHQPMGVYVYYVRAITLLEEEFEYKGNVTLVR